jgi:GNAT superfamily N-acetyltransferase
MIIREAVRADLPAILAMLADDVLGRTRDTGVLSEAHKRAFDEIDADPRNLLIVGEDGGEVVAYLQITYIPGLSRHGAERCQVEAVRVRADRRGAGLGQELMIWVIDRARERGCAMVQLTSDRSRLDAHRFYERLGFASSHVGMKLTLR